MHNRIYRITPLALSLIALLAAGGAVAAEKVAMNGPDGVTVTLDAARLSALPATEAVTTDCVVALFTPTAPNPQV